ncbi:hypothetical protein HMPREF0813_01653 [Streptococcus anginosus F0211]|uniref:Uncharacterized protein n=1 Tax=Streptococcus anginosus F0211 TaxID=706437 RepID=E6J309_STRAP|nr:hypothetical protein HMPREF0813_01653 [Streptococcus anginosus F0211]
MPKFIRQTNLTLSFSSHHVLSFEWNYHIYFFLKVTEFFLKRN